MKAPEIILSELMKSMRRGSLLGLLIEIPSSTSAFVITKVTKIIEDPENPNDPIIALNDTDIHGNPIGRNVIRTSDITDVRPYYALSGVFE